MVRGRKKSPKILKVSIKNLNSITTVTISGIFQIDHQLNRFPFITNFQILIKIKGSCIFLI